MTDRTRPPERRHPAPPPPRRYRTAIVVVVVVVLLVGVGVLVGVLVTPSSPKTATPGAVTPGATAPGATTPAGGPEGIPLESGPVLAPASTAAIGQAVDGIQCDASEQVAYHIHTHLSIFVDGTLRPVPAGIGIVSPVAQPTPNGPFDGASRCYYWLHVHAQDGVIHIESPTEQLYTLGQFFDEWQQPLSSTQVGPATGPLTAFVDGRQYRGDPRSIALGSREDIQLDVGTLVPPVGVDWTKTSL